MYTKNRNYSLPNFPPAYQPTGAQAAPLLPRYQEPSVQPSKISDFSEPMRQLNGFTPQNSQQSASQGQYPSPRSLPSNSMILQGSQAIGVNGRSDGNHYSGSGSIVAKNLLGAHSQHYGPGNGSIFSAQQPLQNVALPQGIINGGNIFQPQFSNNRSASYASNSGVPANLLQNNGSFTLGSPTVSGDYREAQRRQLLQNNNSPLAVAVLGSNPSEQLRRKLQQAGYQLSSTAPQNVVAGAEQFYRGDGSNAKSSQRPTAADELGADEREFLGDVESIEAMSGKNKHERRSQVHEIVTRRLHHRLQEKESIKQFYGSLVFRLDNFTKLNTAFKQVQLHLSLVRKSDILAARERDEERHRDKIHTLQEQLRNAQQSGTAEVLRAQGELKAAQTIEYEHPRTTRKTIYYDVNSATLTLQHREVFARIVADTDLHIYVELYAYTKHTQEIVKNWSILPIFNQYYMLQQGRFSIPLYPFEQPVWKVFSQRLPHIAQTTLQVRVSLPKHPELDTDKTSVKDLYIPLEVQAQNNGGDQYRPQYQKGGVNYRNSTKSNTLSEERQRLNQAQLVNEISYELLALQQKKEAQLVHQYVPNAQYYPHLSQQEQPYVRPPNKFELLDQLKNQSDYDSQLAQIEHRVQAPQVARERVTREQMEQYRRKLESDKEITNSSQNYGSSRP